MAMPEGWELHHQAVWVSLRYELEKYVRLIDSQDSKRADIRASAHKVNDLVSVLDSLEDQRNNAGH